MPTSATIYCRISSDPTGQAAGVERQERECRELCARLGLGVTEVLIDNDVSATSRRRRPAFERLLVSAPDVIVVWHTDRLVRLTADLERVISLGVNVHAVTAGHLDLSNPAGRAVARTVTAWATYEGEQKAERQRAAHRQRREAGRNWWSHRPFGYEMDGTLRPAEAEALREAYVEALSGRANAETARRFNEAGLTTTHGNQWTGATIHQLLINPRNAGLQSYMGESTGKLGSWSPIVSEEDWLATRRLLTTAGRRPGKATGRAANLLTGIAICDRCAHTMRVGSRPSYRIYQCSNCHGCSAPLDMADDYIKELLSQYIIKVIPEVMRPNTRVSTGDTPGAQAADLRATRQRLTEIEDDYTAGDLGRPAYARMAGRLRERITALEGELADRRIAEEAHDGLRDLTGLSKREVDDKVSSLNVQQLRDLVIIVFAQVRVKSVGRKGRYKATHDQYIEVLWRQELTAAEASAHEVNDRLTDANAALAAGDGGHAEAP